MMKWKVLVFAFLFAVAGGSLRAQVQTFSGIGSRWSDSFVEWDLLAFSTDKAGLEEDEEPPQETIGELKLRWLNVRDDWSEWDFEIFGQRGTIRQKWKDDFTNWELRTYDGAVVTMRAAWANDLNEWRITDNDFSLTLKSRWTNQLDEWLVQDPTRGRFYMYTLRQRDPRDWVIEDQLDSSVSLPMRMALVFITVFHGSPRM
ncbi:MAG: hypothetical protein ABIQ93_12075 [Saprospiraceae bacterium]